MQNTIQDNIKEAYLHGGNFFGQGKVATYIPYLAKGDVNHLGIAVTSIDGQCSGTGNMEQYFTMQSIAKVIVLATALTDVGFEKTFSCVGMEPTGDSFNSIVKLETNSPKPFHPMINAGAIALLSCINGATIEDRFDRLLAMASTMLRREDITYDRGAYRSERDTGDKNRALAYLMRANGVFPDEPEDLLELHFKMSSLLVNCKDISHMGAVLANRGILPTTNESAIPAEFTGMLCSLMSSYGMYDASGEYALRVGLPSKSGVSGGILAVVPKKMGIGVYSPALDEKGNSFCGIKVLEYLSTHNELSIYM